MQVIFKNSWFTGDRRFRKNSLPQEVPDELKSKLPKDCKIVTDWEEPEDKEESLRDYDEERVASDQYSQIMNDAQATEVLNNSYSPINIASDAAMELMAQNSINPDSITGTGKDGRITKYDVDDYLKDRSQ